MNEDLVRSEPGDLTGLQIGIDQDLEGVGVDGPEALRIALDLGPDTAHRSDRFELRKRCQALGNRRRESEKVRVSNDVVGGDGIVEDVSERRPQRRCKHCCRADESDPDHQR